MAPNSSEISYKSSSNPYFRLLNFLARFYFGDFEQRVDNVTQAFGTLFLNLDLFFYLFNVSFFFNFFKIQETNTAMGVFNSCEIW